MQKTAYEMRISDWSSDVFSSDLRHTPTCFAPGCAVSSMQRLRRSSIQQRVNATIPQTIRNSTAERVWRLTCQAMSYPIRRVGLLILARSTHSKSMRIGAQRSAATDTGRQRVGTEYIIWRLMIG